MTSATGPGRLDGPEAQSTDASTVLGQLSSEWQVSVDSNPISWENSEDNQRRGSAVTPVGRSAADGLATDSWSSTLQAGLDTDKQTLRSIQNVHEIPDVDCTYGSHGSEVSERADSGRQPDPDTDPPRPSSPTPPPPTTATTPRPRPQLLHLQTQEGSEPSVTGTLVDCPSPVVAPAPETVDPDQPSAVPRMGTFRSPERRIHIHSLTPKNMESKSFFASPLAAPSRSPHRATGGRRSAQQGPDDEQSSPLYAVYEQLESDVSPEGESSARPQSAGISGRSALLDASIDSHHCGRSSAGAGSSSALSGVSSDVRQGLGQNIASSATSSQSQRTAAGSVGSSVPRVSVPSRGQIQLVSAQSNHPTESQVQQTAVVNETPNSSLAQPVRRPQVSGHSSAKSPRSPRAHVIQLVAPHTAPPRAPLQRTPTTVASAAKAAQPRVPTITGPGFAVARGPRGAVGARKLEAYRRSSQQVRDAEALNRYSRQTPRLSGGGGRWETHRRGTADVLLLDQSDFLYDDEQSRYSDDFVGRDSSFGVLRSPVSLRDRQSVAEAQQPDPDWTAIDAGLGDASDPSDWVAIYENPTASTATTNKLIQAQQVSTQVGGLQAAHAALAAGSDNTSDLNLRVAVCCSGVHYLFEQLLFLARQCAASDYSQYEHVVQVASAQLMAALFANAPSLEQAARRAQGSQRGGHWGGLDAADVQRLAAVLTRSSPLTSMPPPSPRVTIAPARTPQRPRTASAAARRQAPSTGASPPPDSFFNLSPTSAGHRKPSFTVTTQSRRRPTPQRPSSRPHTSDPRLAGRKTTPRSAHRPPSAKLRPAETPSPRRRVEGGPVPRSPAIGLAYDFLYKYGRTYLSERTSLRVYCSQMEDTVNSLQREDEQLFRMLRRDLARQYGRIWRLAAKAAVWVNRSATTGLNGLLAGTGDLQRNDVYLSTEGGSVQGAVDANDPASILNLIHSPLLKTRSVARKVRSLIAQAARLPPQSHADCVRLLFRALLNDGNATTGTASTTTAPSTPPKVPGTRGLPGVETAPAVADRSLLAKNSHAVRAVLGMVLELNRGERHLLFQALGAWVRQITMMRRGAADPSDAGYSPEQLDGYTLLLHTAPHLFKKVQSLSPLHRRKGGAPVEARLVLSAAEADEEAKARLKWDSQEVLEHSDWMGSEVAGDERCSFTDVASLAPLVRMCQQVCGCDEFRRQLQSRLKKATLRMDERISAMRFSTGDGAATAANISTSYLHQARTTQVPSEQSLLSAADVVGAEIAALYAENDKLRLALKEAQQAETLAREQTSEMRSRVERQTEAAVTRTKRDILRQAEWSHELASALRLKGGAQALTRLALQDGQKVVTSRVLELHDQLQQAERLLSTNRQQLQIVEGVLSATKGEAVNALSAQVKQLAGQLAALQRGMQDERHRRRELHGQLQSIPVSVLHTHSKTPEVAAAVSDTMNRIQLLLKDWTSCRDLDDLQSAMNSSVGFAAAIDAPTTPFVRVGPSPKPSLVSKNAHPDAFSTTCPIAQRRDLTQIPPESADTRDIRRHSLSVPMSPHVRRHLAVHPDQAGDDFTRGRSMSSSCQAATPPAGRAIRHSPKSDIVRRRSGFLRRDTGGSWRSTESAPRESESLVNYASAKTTAVEKRVSARYELPALLLPALHRSLVAPLGRYGMQALADHVHDRGTAGGAATSAQAFFRRALDQALEHVELLQLQAPTRNASDPAGRNGVAVLAEFVHLPDASAYQTSSQISKISRLVPLFQNASFATVFNQDNSVQAFGAYRCLSSHASLGAYPVYTAAIIAAAAYRLDRAAAVAVHSTAAAARGQRVSPSACSAAVSDLKAAHTRAAGLAGGLRANSLTGDGGSTVVAHRVFAEDLSLLSEDLTAHETITMMDLLFKPAATAAMRRLSSPQRRISVVPAPTGSVVPAGGSEGVYVNRGRALSVASFNWEDGTNRSAQYSSGDSSDDETRPLSRAGRPVSPHSPTNVAAWSVRGSTTDIDISAHSILSRRGSIPMNGLTPRRAVSPSRPRSARVSGSRRHGTVARRSTDSPSPRYTHRRAPGPKRTFSEDPRGTGRRSKISVDSDDDSSEDNVTVVSVNDAGAELDQQLRPSAPATRPGTAATDKVRMPSSTGTAAQQSTLLRPRPNTATVTRKSRKRSANSRHGSARRSRRPRSARKRRPASAVPAHRPRADSQAATAATTEAAQQPSTLNSQLSRHRSIRLTQRTSADGDREYRYKFRFASIPPLTIPECNQLIASIYQAKVIADSMDDKQGLRRKSVIPFISEFMLRLYGLKSMARNAVLQLERSIIRFADISARCRMFGWVLGLIDSGFDIDICQILRDVVYTLQTATANHGAPSPPSTAPTVVHQTWGSSAPASSEARTSISINLRAPDRLNALDVSLALPSPDSQQQFHRLLQDESCDFVLHALRILFELELDTADSKAMPGSHVKDKMGNGVAGAGKGPTMLQRGRAFRVLRLVVSDVEQADGMTHIMKDIMRRAGATALDIDTFLELLLHCWAMNSAAEISRLTMLFASLKTDLPCVMLLPELLALTRAIESEDDGTVIDLQQAELSSETRMDGMATSVENLTTQEFEAWQREDVQASSLVYIDAAGFVGVLWAVRRRRRLQFVAERERLLAEGEKHKAAQLLFTHPARYWDSRKLAERVSNTINSRLR